jgi:hypothetical protein
VGDSWFWFDRPLDDGRLPVDILLGGGRWALTNRERQYLELARESCLRLYEVVDTLPGESVTLEDALDGGRVTVSERTASRSLERATLVAARVMPGPGQAPAVIEAGFLAFPFLAKRSVVEQTLERLRDFRAHDSRAPVVAFLRCRRRCSKPGRSCWSARFRPAVTRRTLGPRPASKCAMPRS